MSTVAVSYQHGVFRWQLSFGIGGRIQRNTQFHLYSLMDAAYDAKEIRGYIEGKGRVALIDQNRRRADVRPPLDPAQKQRFKIRSTVERTNSHLKDWFFSGKVYVRGIRKVRAHLMVGVVCLAAVKILQQLILPRLEKEAA